MAKQLIYTIYDTARHEWVALHHASGTELHSGNIFEIEDWLSRHPQYTEYTVETAKQESTTVSEPTPTGKVRSDTLIK